MSSGKDEQASLNLCLRETRLTIARMARDVSALDDPKAVFFSATTFRQPFCSDALERSVLRALTKNVAAAEKVFSRESHRRLFQTVPKPPGNNGDGGAGDGCNTNYSGCLKAKASDYDCTGGTGDGPYYTGVVEVLGVDEYGLDDDGDGFGCNG